MLSGFTDAIGAAIFMAVSLMSSNLTYKINPEKVEVKEVFCLAQNIWFEARSSTYEDQMMVGYTTINRTRDRRYPESICEVVWENQQFSWTHDGQPDSIKLDTPDRVYKWSRIVELAVLIITNNIEDPSNGATHYHATYVRPGWSTRLIKVSTVGGHHYYRYRDGERFMADLDEETLTDIEHSRMRREVMSTISEYLTTREETLASNMVSNISYNTSSPR